VPRDANSRLNFSDFHERFLGRLIRLIKIYLMHALEIPKSRLGRFWSLTSPQAYAWAPAILIDKFHAGGLQRFP